MTLSDQDFAKLIGQANLVLKEDEKAEIHSQLDEALGAVKVLDELDTTNVEELAQPIKDLTNVWREDVVTPSLSQSIALSQGKTHGEYFMVNNVFESQDN